MVRIALIAVGIALVLAGAVVLPMPIPLGAVMMVAGLTILIGQSPFTARQVRALRRKNTTIDTAIRRIENHLPEKLREIIRSTEP